MTTAALVDGRRRASPCHDVHRFAGNTYNSAGLNYLNNRYHDPITGQFISVDPLVQKTGQPYIYGSANPTTYSRSRPSRVTPPRQSSCRGSLFLNNRYHDPVTGQFISVDPLVTTTGQPYIYGAANPTTYSDPDGLCPISGPGSAEACWAFAAVDYTTTVHLTDETLTVITSGRPTVHYEREELSHSREGGLDPLGAIGGIVDDAVGGLEQIVDPLTCGLKGINTVTKKMGNCTAEQVERQEQYKDTGEAVCEASRTPLVGSYVPEWDLGSVGWSGISLVVSDYVNQMGKAGSNAAVTAARSGSVLSQVATAVDLACRVAP